MFVEDFKHFGQPVARYVYTKFYIRSSQSVEDIDGGDRTCRLGYYSVNGVEIHRYIVAPD